MGDEKDLRAKNKEIAKQSNEVIPMADSTNAKTTTILTSPIEKGSWFKRNWKLTCTFAAVVLGVSLISGFLAIPNGVMDLFLKWRELFKGNKVFSATAIVSIGSPTSTNRMGGIEHWIYNPPANRVYPIHVCIFMQFVNLKPSSVMIDAYSVETMQSNGKWVAMPCLDTRWGEIVSMDGKTEMTRYKFFPLFDEVKNTNIPSGDTKKGWIFLGMPAGGLDRQKLRFRFTDGAGDDFVEPIRNPPIGKPEQRDTSTVDFREGSFYKLESINFSNVTAVFWEDRYKH